MGWGLLGIGLCMLLGGLPYALIMDDHATDTGDSDQHFWLAVFFLVAALPAVLTGALMARGVW